MDFFTFELIADPEIWASLITLMAFEIVLGKGSATFAAVVTQIAIIDMVFSLDSVITAVGMADHLLVMVVAVVAAILVMVLAADRLAKFIGTRPTVKMLGLSFVLLIGVVLIAECMHFHIPKGYVYFALAFSVTVEALYNWAQRRRRRALVAGKA